MRLRGALPDDIPVILGLIRELAAFERAPDAVKMTAAQLSEALFGVQPRAEALLVEIDGGCQAIALWYESFNTWTGQPALSVEDVFVRPAYRGQGIGRAIFRHLAKLARQRNYLRMDWQVLDWNAAAIRFYESLGARQQSEWRRYRLSGEALDAVASGASHG